MTGTLIPNHDQQYLKRLIHGTIQNMVKYYDSLDTELLEKFRDFCELLVYLTYFRSSWDVVIYDVTSEYDKENYGWDKDFIVVAWTIDAREERKVLVVPTANMLSSSLKVGLVYSIGSEEESDETVDSIKEKKEDEQSESS